MTMRHSLSQGTFKNNINKTMHKNITKMDKQCCDI